MLGDVAVVALVESSAVAFHRVIPAFSRGRLQVHDAVLAGLGRVGHQASLHGAFLLMLPGHALVLHVALHAVNGLGRLVVLGHPWLLPHYFDVVQGHVKVGQVQPLADVVVAQVRHLFVVAVDQATV